MQTIQALVALVKPQFPMVLSNEAPPTRVVSAGLLARITGTAEASLRIAELQRGADLMVAARCLFEHVIVFAWLTGPTDEAERMLRLSQWQVQDHLDRGRADKEITALLGSPFLTEDNRQLAEQAKAVRHQGATALADRAAQADREWAGRMRFASSGGNVANRPYSLRASYSTLYRFASSMAHPTLTGLNLVATRTETHTVIELEPRGRAAAALGIALGVFGVSLYISSFGISRVMAGL